MQCKHNLVKLTLITSIFACSFSNLSHAKDEPEKSLYQLSLSELMQMTVTGSTLTEKSLKYAPSAVTVFTYDSIVQMGLDSLDELMNFVPGYQSYRSSNFSVVSPFSVRGRRIGSSGAEVLVLVDGQRMENIRTGGSLNVIPKFPLDSIERVEFIRGPGSAIYGSSAMMGVVNIITRTGRNKATIAYGNLKRVKTSLAVTHSQGGLTIDVQGYSDQDQGETYSVQSIFGPEQVTTEDPRKLEDLFVKIKLKNTQIDLQHHQSHTDGFYLSTILFNDYNIRESQFDSIAIKQNIEYKALSSWLRLSHSMSSEFITLSSQSPPEFGISPFTRANSENYAETKIHWHNDFSIDDTRSIQAGLDYRHLNLPSSTFTNSNYDLNDANHEPSPNDTSTTITSQLASKRDVTAAYIQYQYQYLDSTHLTLGLRYDRFSQIGGKASPRLGVVHKLGQNQSIKLLYGESFRAPTEDELNLVGNPRFISNPNLKPETVQTLDLLWLGQWKNLHGSAGYFENHFDDSIASISLPEGINRYANTQQGPTKGIELELAYKINRHWHFSLNHTSITERPKLSYREAKQLAALTLSFRYHNWNSSLHSIYHSERESPLFDGSLLKLSDYWLLGGKISCNLSSQWQVFLQAKNLLNEDYHTPAASAFLSEGIQNRGRVLHLGINLQF